MSGRSRILLIDDDTAGRNALRRALEKQGHVVEAHASGPPALHSLETGGRFDLVITDLRMPEMDGMEGLRRAKGPDAQAPVLLITAFGTIDNAVEAMQIGARDYLTKPLDLFEVRTKVRKALEATCLARENRNLADENRRLRRQVETPPGLDRIIGASSAVVRLRKRIEQVAPVNSSVLISGESGTGKELVAQALHEGSPRRERAFLPINCAAIPRDILESELFGHERGAFTGATSRKPGKFELASGGTLFLDEIGELPGEMQAKLLRVLEDKSFMRVGGVETVEVDVRIVAATNADLEQLVNRGDFRTDLYYRLKVVQIEIPPLRARPDDIPALARHFLARLAEEYDRPGLALTDAALEALTRQRWPGNVRELRNLLESVAVLNEGTVLGIEALPADYGGSEAAMEPSPAGETTPEKGSAPHPARPPADPRAPAAAGRGNDTRSAAPAPQREGSGPYEPGLSMAELEKRHILRTLKELGNNRTRAAKVLGIGRRTLQRKLDEYREQGEEIPQGVPD